MRVLMFGWEFPPYKSGGLGTACYGMGPGAGEERHGNPVRLAADPLGRPGAGGGTPVAVFGIRHEGGAYGPEPQDQ